MARYYRRRYTRTIVRAPKKRWASNIRLIDSNLTPDTGGYFHYEKQIAANSSEADSPTPIVIKTGNFKVQFDMNVTVGAAGLIQARAYVLYVPQGVFPQPATSGNITTLIENHPEWIMAWKQIDFGNANAAGSVDTSVVRMSSRLKRNLNTGDRIMFVITGSADFTGVQYASSIRGMVQYWTCAN